MPETMIEVASDPYAPTGPDDFRLRYDIIRERCPLPSLDIEGVPAAGPDFHREAEALAGGEWKLPILGKGKGTYNRDDDAWPLKYLYWHALYTPGFRLGVNLRGHRFDADFMSGTFWSYPDYGPRAGFRDEDTGLDVKIDVMVVGKHPGQQELSAGINFCGPSSKDLRRALIELQLTDADLASWYITNAVKHDRVDPASDVVTTSLIKNCAPLLRLEILILKPRYILCLGSEAVRAVIGPVENVSRLLGRVVEIAIPTHRRGEPREFLTVKCMGVVHPAYVFRKPEAYHELRDGLAQFWSLTQGHDVGREEDDLEHVCVYTEEKLKAEVDNVLAAYDGTPQPIAVDAEWHGKFPGLPGSYLRTVQFSHRPKYACAVVLYNEQGKPCFWPDQEAAIRQLTRLLKSTPEREVRAGGHFFRADLPWLKTYLRLDLTDEFRPAADPAATRTHGGWDTGYLAHAVQEACESFKLESLAARLCRVPRYDIALDKWKTKYCKDHNLTDKELEGYGECPDEILLPYACYDADATLRLFLALNGAGDQPGLLDADQYKNSSREAALISQRASLPFLEMETFGVGIDRTRGDELTHLFLDARDRLTLRFQTRILWRDFNPNSVTQCREFLYGTELNSTVDKATGRRRRLRPDWCSHIPNVRPGRPELAPWQPVSLDLTPIKASGPKAPTWDRVKRDMQQHIYNPSTDKETLGILGYQYQLVAELRDIRFLSQVMKGVLRSPRAVADGTFEEDEEGNWEYDGGLLYWATPDGQGGWRVYSHFYPVETGRCSSSRPNLQNISKRREGDYAAILGQWAKDPETKQPVAKGRYIKFFKGRPRYTHPLRSIVRATSGRVLIEADYKGAELAAIAWLANCPRMIADMKRNALPEDHPDYLDLHAQTAIAAFHLDTPVNRQTCEAAGITLREDKLPPNKKVLKILGRESLRTGAKTVNFSVPYQSGPAAIARKCREEGADVSVDEAQALIDGYYELYPENKRYLDECMTRVTDPGFLYGTFGRLRRFQPSTDEKVLAEMQRQACNFPIQNCVADAISLAMWELWEYRRRHAESGGPHWFNFCLQIHDALLFECDPQDVEFTVRAIRECMVNRVPIWPRHLDGTPQEHIKEPYRFGVDVELYEWWGEPIPKARARKLNLPNSEEIARMVA